MNAPINWLLEGEPWIAYRTRLDLLGEPEPPRAVREKHLNDPRLENLVAELANWPGQVISSHKSAGQPFHKLTFVADMGFKADDAAIRPIIERILEHQSDEGPFQLPTNVPVHFGGSGADTWAWALCDAPLVVYALVKFGLEDDPRVQRAVDYLVNLVRQNGWPCVVSKELGKFRGPGRKDDPCPFATLAMLKLLAQVPAERDGQAARAGAESILNLWATSLDQHPYMFFMGADFRKIKVPFVWYDLIHTLDVLSQFPWLRGDARLLAMVELLKSKADDEGRFTLESVWTAWKDWEFGQKKAPSRWLTFSAWRIIQRVESVPQP